MTSDFLSFVFSDDSNAVSKISDVLPRLDSVVIGPGLGRDEQLLQNVKVSCLPVNINGNYVIASFVAD